VKNISGIQAVSFDGDATLWDFEKVMRHSLNHVLRELEQVDTDVAGMLNIEKMIRIRNEVAEKLKGKIINLERVRLEAFKQTLEEIGKPDEALASYLNQVYLRHRFEDIELYDDVLPTLTVLKDRYTIGLLSNGNSYPERCELEGLFQFVVFSQDYGFEKPDPKLFQIALDKAGCLNSQLLHVGDSITSDIVGASNLGIKSVWLNRNREENSSDVKVDYEIGSLLDLLDLV